MDVKFENIKTVRYTHIIGLRTNKHSNIFYIFLNIIIRCAFDKSPFNNCSLCIIYTNKQTYIILMIARAFILPPGL